MASYARTDHPSKSKSKSHCGIKGCTNKSSGDSSIIRLVVKDSKNKRHCVCYSIKELREYLTDLIKKMDVTPGMESIFWKDPTHGQPFSKGQRKRITKLIQRDIEDQLSVLKLKDLEEGTKNKTIQNIAFKRPDLIEELADIIADYKYPQSEDADGNINRNGYLINIIVKKLEAYARTAKLIKKKAHKSEVDEFVSFTGTDRGTADEILRNNSYDVSLSVQDYFNLQAQGFYQ